MSTSIQLTRRHQFPEHFDLDTGSRGRQGDAGGMFTFDSGVVSLQEGQTQRYERSNHYIYITGIIVMEISIIYR